MNKKIMSTIVFLLILFPLKCSALNSNEQFEVIAEETKYYKVIEFLPNNMMSYNNSTLSKTYEITEEEYEQTENDINPLGSAEVNTAYKKMTTSISSNGKLYRYKNVLNWKNMPATRSYDIIGIGFLGSVKVKGTVYFNQESCTTISNCTNSSTSTIQKFQAGVGASFKLPTGNISILSQMLYFDVEKNTTSTIISQAAYGDYSHAQKTISMENAKKYVVSGSGIVLNSSIQDYYDEISVAKATWSGTW